MAHISVPAVLEPAYDGEMEAQVIEIAEQDTPVPTNHIRTTQNWRVNVKWEMRGALAAFLVDEFRLRAFLESIGPGAELALPIGGPLVVNTMAGPLSFPGGVATRTYTADINVPAGTVPPGVYKLVTTLQLHDDAPPGAPYPIAGMVEGPFLNFFNPGP
ncbi:MAG: hypothetical protein K6U78_18935 [Anaerolineae bacterium]|nr:hypothetical protein [Anaerolineae bacterium]